MNPYRLWLISETKPESPDEIHSSNQMIAWGLLTGFAQLPHVAVTHSRTQPREQDVQGKEWEAEIEAAPDADFTLIHSYTPAPIFDKMPLIRQKTRGQILWMSECPYPHMDHCFTFLPFFGSEQILFPALLPVMNESMVGVQRMPGSILLDHAWGWAEGHKYRGGPDPNLWCTRLYKWLEPWKDLIVVGQLERPEHERLAGITIPDWVRRVPGAFYPEYLRATAPYENFIMTHPGSYEHSIIDMVARGIRVLVPTPTVRHVHRDGWAIVQAGRPFAPLDTIARFQLPMFSSKSELLDTLNTPFNGSSWRELCTDMSAVAKQVDSYCQKVLNGSNR